MGWERSKKYFTLRRICIAYKNRWTLCLESSVLKKRNLKFKPFIVLVLNILNNRYLFVLAIIIKISIHLNAFVLTSHHFFTCHLPDTDIFSLSYVSWYSEHIKKEMDSLWFWFLSCYEVFSRTFTSIALHAMDFEFHICKAEWQDILLIYCYATNYPRDNGLQEQICFSLLSLMKVWLTLVWLGNCTFVSLRTHPDGVFWECTDAFSLPMWVIFMTLLCGVGLESCLEFLPVWPLPWYNSLLFPE